LLILSIMTLSARGARIMTSFDSAAAENSIIKAAFHARTAICDFENEHLGRFRGDFNALAQKLDYLGHLSYDKTLKERNINAQRVIKDSLAKIESELDEILRWCYQQEQHFGLDKINAQGQKSS
jgi:hypothetical protein